jgi:hypothetical protein
MRPSTNADLHRTPVDFSAPDSYQPKRTRWPGLIGAAAIVGAVVTLALLSHDNSANHPASPVASGAKPPAETTPPVDAAKQAVPPGESSKDALPAAPAQR